MNSGIYILLNLINGCFYIGQTSNFENREYDHFQNLKLKKHINPYLQNAFNKYSEENFKFIILSFCDVSKLTIKEQFFIDFFGIENLYNLNPIADKPPNRKGCIVSANTRQKISQANKNRVFSKEHKQNISLSKLGHEVSTETREKIRKANLNKIISEETKKKMSLNNSRGMLGKKQSKKEIDKKSKEFIIISPRGEIIKEKNITEFCRQNKLEATNLCKVLNGKRKSHKGWTKPLC